jgi:DNA-directed RNA polymerase subunit RPC12/RpoP
MGETPPVERFRCPACGKQFTWKDELAGRQVKCKCGRLFVATRAAPVSPAKSATTAPVRENGEFDLYPDDAPRPAGLIARRPAGNDDDEDDGPSEPEPPPTPQPMPPALAAYPGVRRRVVVQEEGGDVPSVWKDTFIPVILGTLGLIGWGVLLIAFPFRGIEPARVLLMAGVMLVVNVLVVMMALYAAAALMGVNFGAPRAAIAKIAGMSLLASAIFIGCMRLDYPEVRGAIAGFHVVLLVYWIAFSALFDLELQETVLTVAIVGLVQAMAGCVVLKV